jgi:hypothetical protein
MPLSGGGSWNRTSRGSTPASPTVPHRRYRRLRRRARTGPAYIGWAMTSNRVALRGTRNPTSKPIVWTALNAHGSNIGRCQWNAIASRFGTATLSNTWASGYTSAHGLRKRRRYRLPRNCRKAMTLGTAAGFRWKIRAAMKSRRCRSASEERSRSTRRQPAGRVGRLIATTISARADRLFCEFPAYGTRGLKRAA